MIQHKPKTDDIYPDCFGHAYKGMPTCNCKYSHRCYTESGGGGGISPCQCKYIKNRRENP